MAGGIRIVPLEVKFLDRRKTSKAFAKNVFINQERNSEVRRRSDTIVVPTINDANDRSGGIIPMTRQAASGKPKSLGSGGHIDHRHFERTLRPWGYACLRVALPSFGAVAGKKGCSGDRALALLRSAPDPSSP
ncbi:hypothetical protein SKAU_G00071200 [Synaphobranchus kaupii]|uniref:Uncharacterized protein n=1 Tax=Synaphobranchus kaupii TaxID=118154 RepID=A0A9Q1G6Z3_SYNKA|nr:hypothetical protein SKAU_G00071200 [Synaphobranchus kaupii]